MMGNTPSDEGSTVVKDGDKDLTEPKEVSESYLRYFSGQLYDGSNPSSGGTLKVIAPSRCPQLLLPCLKRCLIVCLY